MIDSPRKLVASPDNRKTCVATGMIPGLTAGASTTTTSWVSEDSREGRKARVKVAMACGFARASESTTRVMRGAMEISKVLTSAFVSPFQRSSKGVNRHSILFDNLLDVFRRHK